MRALALDTTTSTCSVALVEDDHVLAERSGNTSRSQAEQLPGILLELLDSVGVPLSTIDVFGVAAGPGSFTGLRIGIATMQGLAFVMQRPIAGVSALEALAQIASRQVSPGTVVAAWQDARRHEVFGALYAVSEAPVFSRERLIELDPPAAASPQATLARWQTMLVQEGVFIGDGAVAYDDALAGYRVVRPTPLLAVPIAMMALHRARTGDVKDAGRVSPLYVRRPDAEIAREKSKPAS
jgi:tRNA threonylcarbamoyladenosine biosynthesis protein TsaB